VSITSLTRLGDVAKFVRGITFKPSDVLPKEKSTEGVICMRTKNVQSDLDERDLIGVPKSFVKREEQFLNDGDILISTANSWNLVGKCCWVPTLDYKATLGGFISLARANTKKIEPRYLYHWLSSEAIQHELRRCGRQTTNISNLDLNRAKELKISIPTLPEQKRIAAILDKADAIRRKRQETLTLTENLIQATFLDMFGRSLDKDSRYPEQQLKDVVKEDTIVTYGIVQAGPEFGGGIPYIRSGDIVNGEIDVSRLKKTDPKIAVKFKRSEVHSDDIVMSIRATVGTTALVPRELDGANLTQGTAKISPGDTTKPEFLLNYLRSSTVQHWIQRQVKGATFREITLGRLRELPVRVPPMPLQMKFDTVIKKIKCLHAKNLNYVEQSNNLFNSLQQRAFSGELSNN
jgi:type I restriction enzyme, S subunit